MKASDESCPALAAQAGLILLFDGEVGPFRIADKLSALQQGLDEHNQTDILTWGLDLAPAFPPPLSHIERDSGQWEFVARYSGATVPDSHGVP